MVVKLIMMVVGWFVTMVLAMVSDHGRGIDGSDCHGDVNDK